MRIIEPAPLPYDPEEWARLPFAERARAVCLAWTHQGYGTPPAVFAAYGLKILAYVAAWVWLCGRSPELGSWDTIGTWWAHPLAYQKFVLWSLLFELLGLGCGSGPLTGRYLPPVGGALYFLRPGTLKLPVRTDWGWLGGDRRSWIDVGLYAAVVGLLGVTLLSPTIDNTLLVGVLALAVPMALRDRTLFLAARGEHYLLLTLVFVVTQTPTALVAGAMAVHLALWFFAGFSKLNAHFPAVVGVMVANHPLVPSSLKPRIVRRVPDDLRPSSAATWLSHGGTALELSVPLVLLFAQGAPGPLLWLGLGLMVLLHVYILSSVPMGVPLEWNVLVLYAGFALFSGHAGVTLSQLDAPLLGVVLSVCLVGVPVLGNLRPDLVSFLPSMRYYAGNWAMSVWLVKKGSEDKLMAGIRGSAPWIYHQLTPVYGEAKAIGLVGKVMGFRLMHLHGRTLGPLAELAVQDRLADYHWLDGELIAGLSLGWNFGDGHLHDPRLLAALQRACSFQEGEVRAIFVESQPWLDRRMSWAVHDAATGPLATGVASVDDLLTRQPWDTHPLTEATGDRPLPPPG